MDKPISVKMAAGDSNGGVIELKLSFLFFSPYLVGKNDKQFTHLLYQFSRHHGPKLPSMNSNSCGLLKNMHFTLTSC